MIENLILDLGLGLEGVQVRRAGFPRAPSTGILPTWAPKAINLITYIGLFGCSGFK